MSDTGSESGSPPAGPGGNPPEDRDSKGPETGFKGKAIRVFATEGPQATILDGTEVDTSLVRCVNGEDKRTVLEGFRIVSGSGDPTFYGAEATVGGGMDGMAFCADMRGCRGL